MAASAPEHGSPAKQDTAARLVIVGGVAGGATAAARARRLDDSATITVFEKGPHVSFANCGLPYFVGGEIPERSSLLLQTPESLHARYDLDVRACTEVLAIERQRRVVRVRDLNSRREYEEPYSQLILAPGAEALRPPIPGIDHPRVVTLRSVPDAENLRELLKDAGYALVIGGGFIGLEAVEQMRHRGIPCALVELQNQVMPPADPEMVELLHHELRSNGVDLRLGEAVTALEPYDPSQPEGPLRVVLKSGAAIEKPVDVVVMAVGVRPRVSLAREAGLEVRRGIVVDPFLRTSDPNIFAVGDAIEVQNCVLYGKELIPLAGPANKQARLAANNAIAQLRHGKDGNLTLQDYRCALGTSIVRVFGRAFGMTGSSEKALAVSKTVPYSRCYVHTPNHASYYPSAADLSIKLLFNPTDGMLLGTQIIGPSEGGGVDKRTDVAATAIHGRMTVRDLEEVDLAYAPPFGSAKDPINVAALVAEDMIQGQDPMISSDELAALLATKDQSLVVLDVRMPEEYTAAATGHIDGATNVPIDDLRQWLSTADAARFRDKEVVVYCRAGLRGYVAARMLLQHDFTRVRNLNGGYISWLLSQGRGDLAHSLLVLPLQ